MRIHIIFSLLFLSAGCSDTTLDDHRDLAKKEFAENYKKAMCMPWGRGRQEALRDTIDSARIGILSEEFEDGSIYDWMEDVDEQACLDSGYYVFGPLPIDLEYMAVACPAVEKLAKEPKGTSENLSIDRALANRRERCSELLPLLKEAGYEIRYNTPEYKRTDYFRCQLDAVQPPKWMNDREVQAMKVRSKAWMELCKLFSESDLSLIRQPRRVPQ